MRCLCDLQLNCRSEAKILAMDPIPPLGRIYQLAVQEESQRLASTEYLKTGDRVVLAAKAATEMHRSSRRNFFQRTEY